MNPDELRSQSLSELAARLAQRGATALATVSVERRLGHWDAAIESLLDPQSRERRSLLPDLVVSSRLSPEGLCEALEVILGGVRGASVRELARLAPGNRETAPRGRALAGVMLAGNIPGLAAQSVLPALLLGQPLLLKSASSEPHFAPALLDALALREPAFGEAFAAVSFRGDDDRLLEAAFGGAARLLAYGGAPAIDSLRSRFGDRLVAHGPKASFALVSATSDPLLVARKLARDIALFDQRGCLSVQAIYTSGDANELAEAVAWALALEHRRLPPGAPDPVAAAEVQQLRGEAAMLDLVVADLTVEQGTVIVDREARFRPSPGLRTVRIHSLPRLADALSVLAPWAGKLQGAALGGEEAWALAGELERIGLSRLAEPGELQQADAGWRNGGIDPLDLFR